MNHHIKIKRKPPRTNKNNIQNEMNREEYIKKYNEEHREEIKAKAKIYYQKNKEKIKEYYKLNKENGKLLIKEEHKRYVRNLLWLFDNGQNTVVDYYRVANVYVYYHEIQKNSETMDDFDTETQVRIMRNKLKKMLK